MTDIKRTCEIKLHLIPELTARRISRNVSEEQLDGPEVFTLWTDVATGRDFRSFHYSPPFGYSNMLENLLSLRYWQSRRVEDRGVKALSVETWFHQCWFEKPRIFRRSFPYESRQF